MAHNIETLADGTAAFASARVTPWHHLGVVTTDAMTAEDALRLARLDWTVHKSTEPISAPVLTPDGVVTITHHDRYMTYRQNPATAAYEALGTVGTRYTPIQNAEAFAFLNTLVDEAGAHFETAGSLDHGRRVFMSMKLPGTITIGGVDNLDLYLLAWNRHDGLGAFNVVATPVRVVCQNTLTAGLHAAKASWSIRHTASATGRVQEARETLGLAFAYADELAAEAEALVSQSMTRGEFARFIQQLVPAGPSPSPRKLGNTERVRGEIEALWDADTQANVRGSRWAAWNAVTEWADWVKPIQGSDVDGVKRASRVLADISGAANQQLAIKRQAWHMLTTV